MSASTDALPDLTTCDREPIHLLGSVQPFGFLLAVTPDWLIAHASENAGEWIAPARELIGAPLSRFLRADGLENIRRALSALASGQGRARVFRQALFGGDRLFDVAIHLTNGLTVLEFERADAEDLDVVASVQHAMAGIDTAQTSTQFWDRTAVAVQALTGFDRVMIYQFLHDQSGKVIAEARRPGVESFLGLRYPASDIPQQARALYRRNWLRIIPDARYSPVPVVPGVSADGSQLDLSLSTLRSVSPIHLEYLRNMGVVASMSISLLRAGELWGLIACHHESPRVLSFERRSAAELLGQFVSLKLDAREQREQTEAEVQSRNLHDRIVAQFTSQRALIETLEAASDLITQMIQCDGLAIFADEQIRIIGRAPTHDQVRALIPFLNGASPGRVFNTYALGERHPPSRAYAEKASGVLAIPVSRVPRDYLMLFRQEVAKEVTWAGDPNKPVTAAEGGVRLSPRKSFEAWKTMVRGQSTPWTESDLRAAESIRVALLEAFLRFTDMAEKERRVAQERQEVMIAELNHRVRNILALIRSLIVQSKGAASTLDEFVGIVDGRVRALARAHDQLTERRWAPAPLRDLLEAEIAPHNADWRNRVLLEGPPVDLDPRAYSSCALLFHELLTNAAKHGALSAPNGLVAISWQWRQGTDLRISWRESGGPAVKPPARKGFGSAIIERIVPSELKGATEVRYEPGGIEAMFTVPASLVRGAEEPLRAAPAAAAPVRAAGRALLVEDSVVIAMDAQAMLLGLGFADVDIAGSTREAAAQMEIRAYDFAVLDVNLGDEKSYATARALKAKNVPFLFATGYGEEIVLPPDLADVRLVRKPYVRGDLAGVIARILRAAA